MMIINYTKAHKNNLKRNFAVFSERSERHGPRTDGGDYRTDRRFELRCIEHPWFEIVIDVSIYQSYNNGFFVFQNCTLNYISVNCRHPEYGSTEIASDFEFQTYDCRTDMHEAIMRELVTAYGVISTYKSYWTPRRYPVTYSVAPVSKQAG